MKIPKQYGPDCKPMDHSSYQWSTNFWDQKEYVRDKLKKPCKKCGRKEFSLWLAEYSQPNINQTGIVWTCTDPEYWRIVFERALKEVFFESRQNYGTNEFSFEEKDPIKVIKEWRYQYRIPRRKKKQYKDYGFVRGVLLERAIETMLKNLDEPCVDNVRFTAVNDRKEMKRYNRQREEGCCGSHDEEILICGKKFMIGCNYGH